MERVPSEFCYWEQLQRRDVRWLRRGMRAVFGADPVLPDGVVRAFAASYYDADPVAEAFVEQVYRARGRERGRALLEEALEAGVDSIPGCPPSLRRLFQDVEREPTWLDRARVERGARVFARWGTHLFSFAGAVTLQGYLESSVAKPLALTGAYTGESAQRRFLETAQFWLDVSRPGALAPGGLGRATAVRVRVMHVFVRAGLQRRSDWNADAWGVPISQGDALLTLMGGSLLPGYLLRLLGYRTTREEIEALMHFWRYVGHLIGVQPRWYPQTIEEGLGLLFTSHVKGVGRAGEDARRLAHSYLDSYAPTASEEGAVAWRKALDYRLQLGYVSLFLPRATRRLYGLPAAGLWGLHPMLQFPWVFARETARRRSPRLGRWIERRARARAESWVRARLGTRQAAFRPLDVGGR